MKGVEQTIASEHFGISQFFESGVVLDYTFDNRTKLSTFVWQKYVETVMHLCKEVMNSSESTVFYFIYIFLIHAGNKSFIHSIMQFG